VRVGFDDLRRLGDVDAVGEAERLQAQDRRAPSRSFLAGPEADGRIEDVGEHLAPERAPGEAAGGAHLGDLVAGVADRVEHEPQLLADAFERGAHQVAAAVVACQADVRGRR
jgi:hypothetical protein